MSLTQAEARAAAVTLLKDYATSADVKLQIYPGRPRTIAPPTAFVDGIDEDISYIGHVLQRHMTVNAVLVHGLLDSKEAADQKDAFADGFIEWVRTRYHAANPNSLIQVSSLEDDPNYVPDWLPPEQQKTYYATRLGLEGWG